MARVNEIAKVGSNPVRVASLVNEEPKQKCINTMHNKYTEIHRCSPVFLRPVFLTHAYTRAREAAWKACFSVARLAKSQHPPPESGRDAEASLSQNCLGGWPSRGKRAC